MEALGEDLVLLAIRPGNGTLAARERIPYGLRGSELVRLAASGRVGITNDRIVVLDAGPTGDERLDAALASLTGARRPPRPKAWVGHPGARICDAYLARLAAAGAIREERGKVLGFITVVRWRVTDAARAADARARLDAIVHATGPVSTAQAAFAGLAGASGLGPVLYPGAAGRPLRKRLDQIAQGELTRGAAEAARRGEVRQRRRPRFRPGRHRFRPGFRHRRRHPGGDPRRHPRGGVGRGPRGAPCGLRRRGARRRRRGRRAPLTAPWKTAPETAPCDLRPGRRRSAPARSLRSAPPRPPAAGPGRPGHPAAGSRSARCWARPSRTAACPPAR